MIPIDDFCNLLRETNEFDDLEIRILRAMLILENRRYTKTTATLIAKEAGIPVTNVYKYLYTLQKEGLIESSDAKNKLFWVAKSANPFPRLFSYVTKDFVKKKELFSKLESMYDKFITPKIIWGNERVHEQYAGEFVDKAALLFDIAKEEVLVTTKKFFEDIILLDAIKRAIERGVKIKIITEELHPETVKKFKDIGIEMRLGRAWPYAIVADSRHGITVDEAQKGLWFLNYNSDYKKRFDEIWERAEMI